MTSITLAASPFYVGAVFRQPLNDLDLFGSQFDATFIDFETLVIHLAFPGDNIEETTGNVGREDGAVCFDPLLKTTLSATFA